MIPEFVLRGVFCIAEEKGVVEKLPQELLKDPTEAMVARLFAGDPNFSWILNGASACYYTVEWFLDQLLGVKSKPPSEKELDAWYMQPVATKFTQFRMQDVRRLATLAPENSHNDGGDDMSNAPGNQEVETDHGLDKETPLPIPAGAKGSERTMKDVLESERFALEALEKAQEEIKALKEGCSSSTEVIESLRKQSEERDKALGKLTDQVKQFTGARDEALQDVESLRNELADALRVTGEIVGVINRNMKDDSVGVDESDSLGTVLNKIKGVAPSLKATAGSTKAERAIKMLVRKVNDLVGGKAVSVDYDEAVTNIVDLVKGSQSEARQKLTNLVIMLNNALSGENKIVIENADTVSELTDKVSVATQRLYRIFIEQTDRLNEADGILQELKVAIDNLVAENSEGHEPVDISVDELLEAVKLISANLKTDSAKAKQEKKKKDSPGEEGKVKVIEAQRDEIARKFNKYGLIVTIGAGVIGVIFILNLIIGLLAYIMA